MFQCLKQNKKQNNLVAHVTLMKYIFNLLYMSIKSKIKYIKELWENSSYPHIFNSIVVYIFFKCNLI